METRSAASLQGKLRDAWQRRWVKIGVGIVALLLVILFIVPFFINADTFRPEAENQISTALGRKVSLGHLTFSLFSGSLVASDVNVADDPAYSSTPFLQAKSLHIGVKVGALLFHHQVQISKFTAESPEIHLIPGPNGSWNFSSLGHNGPASAAPQPGTPSTMTIGQVSIRNGSVIVSSLPASGKPFVYQDVDLTVHNLSSSSPMPFEISANLPGNGSLQLSGTAGPIAPQDAIYTPLRATLTVKHFDPVAAGVIDASQGISTIADVNAQLASDGKTLTSTGNVVATNLKLARNGTPAAQPVNVTYTVTNDLGARSGQVSDVALQTGSVAAHLNGSYQLTGQGVNVNLHLAAPNLPIDALEELLPAVGVRLPSGSSLRGGTLTANLTITGPATAPVMDGPVEIANTQLAGFSVGSKIQGLNPLGGNKGGSGGTDIRTLRASVHSTAESTQLSGIYGDIPSLGTATGSGTVSAAGNLNFDLVAKLNTAGGLGTAVNAVGGVAGTLFHTASSSGIPLKITGTTSNPSITANVGAMLKGQTGGLLGKNAAPNKANAASVVKGLLGK